MTNTIITKGDLVRVRIDINHPKKHKFKPLPSIKMYPVTQTNPVRYKSKGEIIITSQTPLLYLGNPATGTTIADKKNLYLFLLENKIYLWRDVEESGIDKWFEKATEENQLEVDTILDQWKRQTFVFSNRDPDTSPFHHFKMTKVAQS